MATKKTKKVVKKNSTKSVTPKKSAPKKTKHNMPGGYLMFAFLIIAAAAAVIAIIGIVLEYCEIDPGTNKEAFEGFFTFIKQCKEVALGVFGIFLVLACFARISNK